MVSDYVPEAGDLIKIEFAGDQAGHEQSGWRPALVLSPKPYNKKSGLAVVVPVTNAVKGYPFEVLLPEGLKVQGAILTDAIRSVDWRHRRARYTDSLPAGALRIVQAKLAALLGLPKPD